MKKISYWWCETFHGFFHVPVDNGMKFASENAWKLLKTKCLKCHREHIIDLGELETHEP